MITDLRSGLRLAEELMEGFAFDTGLAGVKPPRRYLWTDAFAVGNLLGLHRETGEGRWLDLALRLVDQVHHVLGRHRPDDARSGWLSGLAGDEGEQHPTRGGLRIGKPLPERGAGEPFDAQLEWERDGQYLHYLTQWMHALERVAEETGQPVFGAWAVELAEAAHAAFTRAGGSDRSGGGPVGMVWKMSVALDRVAVPSMGQHDPLDARIAYLEIREGVRAAWSSAGSPELAREIAEAADLCRGARWETEDPLGAGALLIAAHRLVRLELRHGIDEGDLLERIIEAAAVSVAAAARRRFQTRPADQHLAFRELGLAIGLHAFERIRAATAGRAGFPAGGAVTALASHLPLAAEIDDFWSDPARRADPAWREHADINTVMLATSLAPGGYLGRLEASQLL
jgi:hypothetical protein